MKHIPNIRDVQNVLVCRCEGSLSAAIISSCCYREIKKANPQARITVACFGPAYDFLKHNPYVDEVFRLPLRTALRPNQHWLGLFCAALKLRRKHFDLVLDSSDKNYFNWRMFKYIAGGKRVLDTHTSPLQPFGNPQVHGSEHEAAILRQLGVSAPDKSYDLPILSTARKAVSDWLEDKKIYQYILFNPAGLAAERCFSSDTMREMFVPLRQPNVAFVVPVTGPYLKTFAKAFKDLPDVYVKEMADVFELFELVRRATLVVTPDTSVVHIAVGFEKPLLAFYNALGVYNAPNHEKALVLQTDKDNINVFDWWQFESLVDRLKKMI